MKTRLLKIPVMVLIAFCFLGCNQALEKERDELKAELEALKKKQSKQEAIIDCRETDRRTADQDLDSKNADLSLKFNYDEKRYQSLHLDLRTGFAILGKAVLNKNKTEITGFTLSLKEAGNCKRYQLENAVYNGYYKNEAGVLAHNIDVKVEKGTNNPKSKSLDFNKNRFSFKPGQIIDIHIVSENNPIDFLTRIGTQFCKSKITGP